jgi:glyoxylase I family protein
MSSIRHVDLVVSSLATSKPFYVALLDLLGWRDQREVVGERGEAIVYLAGPEGFARGAIGLREAPTADGPPYDRYGIGMHHVAFNSPDRVSVDEVAEWLRANGHSIESGPDEYYGQEYYAVFFYDPDGMKLEVVCGPQGGGCGNTS